MWYDVGYLKFPQTFSTSSLHYKNPVKSTLINPPSVWQNGWLSINCSNLDWLSCYISVNVKIWVKLGDHGIEHHQTASALPFQWRKYDFSTRDPKSCCWNQLKWTDATLLDWNSAQAFILTSTVTLLVRKVIGKSSAICISLAFTYGNLWDFIK